jgi:putative restriction endonuclease
MKYWWVNQGQTYAHEVGQDFMWSPLKDINGKILKSYENMKALQPGDIVFSHSKNAIRAIGIVQSNSYIGPQPDFEGTGSSNWSDEGWHCDVAFTELKHPIDYKNRFSEIKLMLPDKYSPLDRNGKAVMAYLFELSEELGKYLKDLSAVNEIQIETLVAQAITEAEDQLNDLEEKEITQKVNLGPLEIENLVKSRRGQGIFKTNVKLYEKKCRVTGLTDKTHLTASHIKPWRKSNDQEKIDGNNGLLLSPHVDRLFDHGFISFTNEGDLMVSKLLNLEVLKFWGLSTPLNVGSFRKEQLPYLEYHRQEIFKN